MKKPDMIIDLKQEAKDFRKWVEQKAIAVVGLREREASNSVGAIVALYNYDQHAWIVLDFNIDEEFEYGGDVSKASWDDAFDRPAWTPFVEAKGLMQMTLVEADGTPHSMTAEDVTDEFLSGHLGKMIEDVLTTAWSDGIFSALPLRPGFVIIVDDFNGSWGWGAKEVSGKLDELDEY